MSEYAEKQRENPQLLECDYVWRDGFLNYVFRVSKNGKRLKIAEVSEPEENAEWVALSKIDLLTNQERCDYLDECEEDDCEPTPFDEADTSQFHALRPDEMDDGDYDYGRTWF